MLKVPLGVKVRCRDSGQILAEIDHHEQKVLIARGGLPGHGIKGAGMSRRQWQSEEERRRVRRENRGKIGQQVGCPRNLKSNILFVFKYKIINIKTQYLAVIYDSVP